MRFAKKIKRLIHNLFRRRQLENALDAELRSYLSEAIELNIAKGMSGENARRQALAQAGGIEQIKEEVREA